MALNLGLALNLWSLGSGAGTSPAAFLGSDLIAWWTTERADLISLSGSQVTAWRDVKAGYSAAQAVSGARPVYSATSFNGSAGITFDAIDDELTCTDAALLAALPTANAAGECWGIAQQDALPGDATNRCFAAFGGTTSTVSRRFGRAVVSAVNRGWLSNGAANCNDTVVDYSGRHVARTVSTVTGMSIAVDGSPLGTEVPLVAATTPLRFRLGAGGSTAAANFWNGIIRDVLVTKPLSTLQASQLTAWCLSRRLP